MTGETLGVLAVDDHAVVVREGYRRRLELNADVQMCGPVACATRRNSAAAQDSSDQCDSIEPSLCGYVTMPHASGNAPICLIG